ncbi:MAG: hypothetical protein ABL901_01110 [Hyphomicrobiaceae bacterium]
MTFEKRAIVSVCERLVRLNARPPLYHDAMTPVQLRRRLARVERWLGGLGRCVIQEQFRAPHPIQPDKRYRKGMIA